MIRALKSATWKVFGASLLAGRIVSPVLMRVQGRPPVAPGQIGLLAVAGLTMGTWSLVSARTWSTRP